MSTALGDGVETAAIAPAKREKYAGSREGFSQGGANATRGAGDRDCTKGCGPFHHGSL
jgi:hypothetical protein